MRRSARLTLKRETLAALTADDLHVVAAGAAASDTCYTCVDPECFVIRDPSVVELTGCCQGIPTFHRGC